MVDWLGMVGMPSQVEYSVTLLRQNSAPVHLAFERLTDAIRWLAAELEVADLDKSYGEIRFNRDVLWRRGNAELASSYYLMNELAPEIAPTSDAAAESATEYDWERFYHYKG